MCWFEEAFTSNEVMVVLVASVPRFFPSKNNFVKALRKVHPEISTVVLNINDKTHKHGSRRTRRSILYGKGFISRIPSAAISFRISAKILLPGESGADRDPLQQRR